MISELTCVESAYEIPDVLWDRIVSLLPLLKRKKKLRHLRDIISSSWLSLSKCLHQNWTHTGLFSQYTSSRRPNREIYSTVHWMYNKSESKLHPDGLARSSVTVSTRLVSSTNASGLFFVLLAHTSVLWESIMKLARRAYEGRISWVHVSRNSFGHWNLINMRYTTFIQTFCN